MKLINIILGIPLGYIMFLCFNLVKNYGLTIILFTFISKIILLPVSLLVQRNSIKMVKLQPEIDQLNQVYEGDSEKIGEETAKLYEKEGYNPAVGCLPMLLQVPIVLGLIQVIYHPLQHLFHLSAPLIEKLISITSGLFQKPLDPSSAQLQVIGAMQNPETLSAFTKISDLSTDTLHQIQTMNLSFLGLDLSAVPSIHSFDRLLWIPLLAGLSALWMCIYQDKANVLQREQTGWGRWGITAFLVAFSTYFAFLVPAGVGLYWIFSNLFAMVLQAVLNLIYDPSQYIDYENRQPKTVKSPKQTLSAEEKANRKREKTDLQRFYDTDNKLLVFYSERSGYYKYFSSLIDYLLEHTKIVIHYVTSDPNDAVFQKEEARLVPYYVGPQALVSFFMRMDADIVIMTMPDLQTYQYKRSVVRKDIEYIFMFHGLGSTTLVDKKGCYDHFDTIFCPGPFIKQELLESEKLYNLPPKRLVEAGFGLIEELANAYENSPHPEKAQKQILIAPSWQEDNILDTCIDDVLNQLLPDDNYRIIVRPHPEYLKHARGRMDELISRWKQIPESKLLFQTDFSSNATVFESDLLITDWSTIAFEFSFSTKKPCLFINTPMKILNPDWQKYSTVPADITWRDKVGKTIDPDHLSDFADLTRDILAHSKDYQISIDTLRQESMYHYGFSAQIGAAYIVQQLKERHKKAVTE